VLIIGLLAACSTRTVSWSDGALDGPVAPTDSRPATDRPFVPDQARRDAATCGGPELAMGLVSTMFDGVPSTTLTRTLPGQVIYHGPVTQPLASSPLFDREIQFAAQTGKTVVIQYYLPGGLQLFLNVGGNALYTITIKRHFIPNLTFTEALVITANEPGPWPFVLIAEPATYGQALDPDDPLISPLKVKLLESQDCPVSTTPNCAPLYIDRLRFEATTGAGLVAAELEQGEVIGLSLFGQKMQIANLASYHQRPACPDGVEWRTSYLLVRQ